MPRVIPSRRAASDIKKAADGDVETMNAFTGLEMQETVMGRKRSSPLHRAGITGIGTAKWFVQKSCSPLFLPHQSEQTGKCCFHTPAQLGFEDFVPKLRLSLWLVSILYFLFLCNFYFPKWATLLLLYIFNALDDLLLYWLIIPFPYRKIDI